MKKTSYIIRSLSILILTGIVLLFSLQSGTTDCILSTTANTYYIRQKDVDLSEAVISLETVLPGINSLAADSENLLFIKVHVKDKYSRGIEGARINLSLEDTLGYSVQQDTYAANDAEVYGRIVDKDGITGPGGVFYTVYIPAQVVGNGHSNITISATLEETKASSSLSLKLIANPVVLIHGYQATSDILSGLANYLQMQGFITYSIDYDSRAGVAAAAEELSKSLYSIKSDLAATGIQIRSFDLISHSMGGLVARYYTCGSEYFNHIDVRKLIFISVPQKGSHFATLGQQYFGDASVMDMSVESELFTYVFPNMINGGLNPSIQTSSILGRYDEVVSSSSADLTQWGISTEMFDVGQNNLTVEKLLSGEILNAENHKLILYNSTVYNRILEMLKTQLQFPDIK